jgi:hypothetical protein
MSKREPKFAMRHPNLKREVLVTITDLDTGECEVFAVEWPEECRVTLGQFQTALPYVQNIEDIANCHNCAFYLKVCTHSGFLKHRKVVIHHG